MYRNPTRLVSRRAKPVVQTPSRYGTHLTNKGMLVNKAQDNLVHFGNNYNLVSEVKANKIFE